MIAFLKKVLAMSELKGKILFTLLLLVVCRIGAYIPVPGISADQVVKSFRLATGGGQNLFQLVDVFTGGAFAHMTVVALGVVPYISASIIMQLLMALVPSLQRDVRENADQGKRKLGRWTRLLTLVLSLFQSALFARQALYFNLSSPGIVFEKILEVQSFQVPWLFFLLVMITMTTGTLLLMWIGEQITEKGIGNGVSMIIALGILSSLPATIGSILKQLHLDSQEAGSLTFSSLFVLAFAFVAIIMGTILAIQGVRKITLQYARRGADMTSEGSSYIPLKVNYAGVIPVIFASSILMFPATIAQFLGKENRLGRLILMLSPGSWAHTIIYVLLIMFFTYFWTATQFHPEQIASEMKKGGAFIPGVRQGKPTEAYLEQCMNRLTFLGAIFLSIIAILPTLVGKVLSVDQAISHFFGGTSLLILIGVILDTTNQIESHLLTYSYRGFMMKKKHFI